MPRSPSVRLLLADVDGTLITKDKVLTDRAVAAVAKLNKAGVLFALTSGRPPRGMAMFVEPLAVTTPIAAFEGGLLVNPDMSIIVRRTVPSDLVTPIYDLLASFSLDVWLYQGSDWLIPDPKGPHVDQEAATVEFGPTVRSDLRLVTDGIVKMVGVSDDYGLVEKAAAAARDQLRRTRLGGALPAVLRRCHPSRRQQGNGRPIPLGQVLDSPPSTSPRSGTCPTTS